MIITTAIYHIYREENRPLTFTEPSILQFGSTGSAVCQIYEILNYFHQLFIMNQLFLISPFIDKNG